MNKLGVSYSGYHPLIPLGNRISMNVKLSDYQKGDFFARRPCDYSEAAKYIYLDMRTYSQQIQDAVKENPKEIFLLLDTSTNDFSGIDSFLDNLLFYIGHRGFDGNVIISAINEPLEHITTDKVHSLNETLALRLKEWRDVSFAVGEMATNHTDFWKSFLNCDYKYDYISFHTGDNCNLSDLKKFLALFPSGTKFIDNEHYFYSGAKKLGYNNMQVVKPFIDYTKFLLADDRIKSVYCCMPFHALGLGKYPWLGLNAVDLKTGKVYPTVAWNELKKLDIKEIIMSKLRELKRGDRGFEVRALQYCLNASQEARLLIDGIFGEKTEGSLTLYNGNHKIPNSNVCSYETWFELIQDINCEMYITDVLRMLPLI